MDSDSLKHRQVNQRIWKGTLRLGESIWQTCQFPSLSFLTQDKMSLDKMKNLSLDDDMLRSELGEVQGIPVMKPICTVWDQVWNFKARPDDLLIATYAKAGLCNIVNRT